MMRSLSVDQNGNAVRFNESDVRAMGRSAFGVRGFNTDGSHVIGVATNRGGEFILSITENGFGKKTPLDTYRLTKRGGKGVRSIQLNERNGELIALRAVTGEEDLMIISDNGIVIRIDLQDVGTYSRNTQGVKLINLTEDSKVSAVAIIDKDEVLMRKLVKQWRYWIIDLSSGNRCRWKETE